MTIIKTNKPLEKRRKHDFYPTPVKFVKAGLSLIPNAFTPKQILDPGAGDGVWGDEAYVKWPESIITGVDIREIDIMKTLGYGRFYKEDYLEWETDTSYDLVMGNPPYKFAEGFVRQSLGHLNDGGYLVFLLRLAFLESKKRLKLWEELPPLKVAVCANRPSFYGNNRTGDTAYSYFVWKKGYTGETGLEWVYAEE
jgi:hypothetical protein